MRDHEDGAPQAIAPSRKPLERSLDLGLVLRVGEGRRLVEHHHGRVLQDRAGNHETLDLAAGEMCPARPHERVGASGQLLQNVRALRRLECGQRLFARSLRARRADVLEHGLPEGAVGLEHKGHALHEFMRVHRTHVHAAERHTPGVDVPEARHERGGRGLAAARGPHEGNRGAGGHLEAHMVERGGIRPFVGEAHVLEANGVVSRRLRCGGHPDHGGGKHLLHAAHGIGCGLERLGHEHHARHGRGDHCGKDRIEREIGDEAREVPLARRGENRRRDEEKRDAVDDRERERLRDLAPLHGVVLREARKLLDGVVERAEAVHRLLEHLDHGDAANILGARLVHLDERFHVARHEVHAAPAHHVEHARKRYNDGRKAGKPEPPVEDEEQREHAEDHGHAARGVRQLVGKQPLGLGRAAVHDAPERPARVRVEVTEARVHEVVRGRLAHVGRAAECRKVRAHEACEVQQDAPRREAERPPTVCGDARGRAPVGRHGDEVARHEPDADVRAETDEH